MGTFCTINIVAARILIKGRVQGVFYRQSAKELARSLGLAGWVRNLFDGDVEAYAQGDSGLVEELVEWCKRGPPGARVDSVDVVWEEAPSEPCSRFEVR